jgi:glycosyltransferase involved in cell wall biosynthesis
LMINGRFVHAEPGGFRRYAVEVAARIPGATIVSPRPRFARGAAGKLWEQTILARRARHEVLWSPATSGPVRHRSHVVTLHDVAPLADPSGVTSLFGAVHRVLLPALAKSADRLVVDSAAMGDELVARFGVSASLVTIAPPGVSDVFRQASQISKAEARQRLDLSKRGIDVSRIVVGGLVSSIPRKNGRGVVDTLDRVVSSGAGEAMTAGWDGPTRVFGRSQRPRSTLVTDLGSLSDEDLALFYRAIDVFVWLPSHEGFGLPVIEAAATGTAVVCSPVPAAVEHLGDSAHIVETTSAAIAAVRDLVEDNQLRDQRAARCLADVEGLTWERTAVAVTRALDACDRSHSHVSRSDRKR